MEIGNQKITWPENVIPHLALFVFYDYFDY